jgi:hypothetical protein
MNEPAGHRIGREWLAERLREDEKRKQEEERRETSPSQRPPKSEGTTSQR